MKKQLLTVAAYVSLQFGLSGINTAQAQYTYTMTNQTWTGFNFTQLPAGLTGTLTSVSVNVTLNASVNYTYADDICVYVAGSPLALGGFLQVGGFSNLNAAQRYYWPNGYSDVPGTTCIGTVALATPIVFTGASSDPFFWIGNGYGASGTSGTFTGSITLNGVSLGATCTAPTLSATTVAALCAGNANGSIDLTTTGGSPTPLIYAWSNGGSTEDLSGLTAGTYSVTVTTQTGGCSATGSYTVAEGAANVTYYADADVDTYGNAAVSQISCTGAPVGYVSNSTDCDDGNAAVNPAATEVCSNGIDDNCDGIQSELVAGAYDNDVPHICTDVVGHMVVYANSGIAPYAYTLNTAGFTDAAGNYGWGANAPGVYNWSVTDATGCSQSGSYTITIPAPIMSYADTDLDGFGAGAEVSVCSLSAGYVLTNTDCNDANAAVNPGATEVCNGTDDDCDGSTDEGVQSTFYADVDGDTYGDASSSVQGCTASVGYVSNSTDCNDNNAEVNPTATESCSTAYDDNCNGIVNEGCSAIAGDNPSNATSMTSSIWPNCNAVNGTLVGAGASFSAQTICLTGEDKWHQFVATSEGVSIVVNSSAADILIELQTAAGALVAQENAVDGLGGETLNHYGLTAGQVYKIGVRNYNSALGTGTYSICAKMLKRGGCDYGPGPYGLCQYFKANWAGAAGTSYTFTFTGESGPASGNVYTRTQTSDICVLSTVLPTLPYGSTYSVLITNTYSINNGAGVAEIISVPGLAPCSMSTATQPVTALRVSNQCAAGPRFRGAIVASLPWVCGSTNWRWEFTELDTQGQPVGLPITVNRGAASNYINLGSVLQLQYGKTYSVRTAPILPYTGSDYQWGAPVCMSIVGTAGLIADGQDASESTLKVEIANEVNMSLYPNPTHGTDVNINLSGVTSENVQIRVVDAMGRQVWSNRYSVDGVLNTNITFERPLANGLYFVEAIFNGEVQTQRMMVQK